MSREDRRKALKLAEKALIGGLDATNTDPYVMVAYTREMHRLIENAKRSGNVDPVARYFYGKVDGTIKKAGNISIACTKGCSHCCNTWVGVNALEIFHIAKIVRQRPATVAKIKAAHEATKSHNLEIRFQHPFPCPLLENDACSIYLDRPHPCRFAASADADICARAYRNITDEAIPTPTLYRRGGSANAIAMVMALKAAGLSYRTYELNGALNRALEREDIETAWLGGEDVFAGLLIDPNNVFSNPNISALYDLAFG